MRNIASKLSLGGLVLFSGSMFLSTAASNIAFVLMFLAAVISYRDVWVTVKRQPLFYVSLAFIAYLIIRQAFGYVYLGGKFADITPWVSLCLFWLVGWALVNHSNAWKWLLALVFVGFVVRLILGFDLEGISRSLHENYNFGFGINKRVATIGFALYTATILIGWLVWHQSIVNQATDKYKKIALFGWVLMLCVLMETLIFTNSRGAWLSTIVAVTFISILAWVGAKQRTAVVKKMVVFFIAFFAIVAINYQTVSDRAAKESGTYQAILQGDVSKVPYTSIGFRIHMYAYAAQLIEKRPWLGWGAKSSKQLLKHAPDSHIHQFPHFHSGYFQVAVQLGLVGVFFFVVLVFWLIRGLYYGYHRGSVKKEYIYFLSASLVMMMLWNMTDVRLEHQDYRIYTLFMLGLAFAVISKSTSKEEALQNNV